MLALSAMVCATVDMMVVTAFRRAVKASDRPGEVVIPNLNAYMPLNSHADSMKTNITTDNRFQSSVDRLKAMGLKFHIEQPATDECMIVIDAKSLVKLIDSKITWPKRESKLIDGYMMIHFWKGEKPEYSLEQ